MKLKDKVALITGGSEGLGKATAFLFAKEGAKVIITGRTESKLQAAVEEGKQQGVDIDYLVGDVSDEQRTIETVEHILDKYGKIDILFNNAGVLYAATTHETDTEIWDKIFDINVKGTYLMTKHVIPHMLERGYGCIVNNSSVVGLKAVPGIAAYNASKGAVTQLTRTSALEYADKGIRVNAICPGTIETPMVWNMLEGFPDQDEARELFKSFHPIGRLGQPDEIAHAVLFLCDDNVGFMTGTMLSVDGGWIAR